MDIAATLAQPQRKARAQQIARYVGRDPDRFAELMRLLLHGDLRTAQCAAWPFGIVCERHPVLGTPWLSTMLDLLERPAHDAVHRNVMRVLQSCHLPEELHGRITDISFRWISDVDRSIAPRAFAITVALRMVVRYPDLGSEYVAILQQVMRQNPAPALRSRGRKALTVLERVHG